MTKKVTDVPFTVVSGPTPRVELPFWFKAFMFGAVALLGLATAVFQTSQRHGPTDPPAQAGAPVARQAPSAR